MEIKYNGLTLGFPSHIDFSIIEDGYGHAIPSFKVMQTPDLSSLVIIYIWVDAISKTYGDREEAFYIDDITPDNYESAKDIVIDVYNELVRAYRENHQRVYNLGEYVNNRYGQSIKR